MKIPKNIPQIKSAQKDESLIFLEEWKKIFKAIHKDIKIYSEENKEFSELSNNAIDGLDDLFSESSIVLIICYQEKVYCFLEGDQSFDVGDKHTPNDDYFVNNRLQTIRNNYNWKEMRNKIIQDIENTYLKIPRP